LRWYTGRLARFCRWWNDRPAEEPSPQVMREFVPPHHQ
jgi:hypothetical protein